MQNLDYLQLLECHNHGIIATDDSGRITFVNKRAKEILSHRKTKFIGTAIEKHMPKTAKLVTECLKSGQPQTNLFVKEENV